MYKFMLFEKNLELSFEFFPPRNEREYTSYENTVKELSVYDTSFVSFTDGAGFSKSREIIRAVKILREYSNTEVVAHITSCDKGKKDIDNLIDTYIENKIDSFLIIRGDCPRDDFLMDLDENESFETDFKYSRDLIQYLNQKSISKIGFGAFPSGHPEDKNFEETINTFLLKTNLGGTFSATQLFFDAAEYIKFYQEVRKHEIAIPIYAGIMPLISFDQAKRFAQICDISLPKKLAEGFQSCKSKEEEREFGINYISELCDDLISFNADGLHFYTLNRFRAIKDIFTKINYEFKKTKKEKL